ncbi:hypothetical protein BD289DRAFT_211577 [Coniella lustricola]|uniref:Uncharacterized protein n=1 Tax=Coniella lustricola TaxID=2025994 RepID=A0A2T2ZS81_9PEZI|nr:hypothetical protein BD289DRAFT_211577 [Coniella lustricola]
MVDRLRYEIYSQHVTQQNESIFDRRPFFIPLAVTFASTFLNRTWSLVLWWMDLQQSGTPPDDCQTDKRILPFENTVCHRGSLLTKRMIILCLCLSRERGTTRKTCCAVLCCTVLCSKTLAYTRAWCRSGYLALNLHGKGLHPDPIRGVDTANGIFDFLWRPYSLAGRSTHVDAAHLDSPHRAKTVTALHNEQRGGELVLIQCRHPASPPSTW